MLTSDLLRARVQRKIVRPDYLATDDPEPVALAESLIELFEQHREHTRGELDAELAELLGTGTDFLLHRGLAKLLFDRSTFEAATAVDPLALRAEVFSQAARARRASETAERLIELDSFDREGVMGRVATKLEITPDDAETALYGDLKSQQRLIELKPCSASWLLRRYNVALAQACVLRATSMRVRLGPSSDSRKQRAIFAKIKFFQLMHRIEGDSKSGYEIHLDGPLSLFQASQKYGLQMASFLPNLLHLDDWSVDATVLWGPRRLERRFRLSPEEGLEPINRLHGQWIPEPLVVFRDRFEALDSDWSLVDDAELIDLGGEGVLVPDFAFEHKADGFRVVMEVLGYWRRSAVERRIELLRQHGPKTLILALAQSLATDRDDLDDLPSDVYLYKRTPLAKQVLRRLEQLRSTGI